MGQWEWRHVLITAGTVRGLTRDLISYSGILTDIRGYYTPAAYEDAKYTVLKGTGSNATHFKFTALCSGCASWPDFDGNPMTLDGTSQANFAYAYSTTPVDEPSNQETTFSIHDSVGHWTHDLGAARSDKFNSWVAANKLNTTTFRRPIRVGRFGY